MADFITALIAFDGFCTDIYLCPPKLKPSIANIIDWPLIQAMPVEENKPTTLQTSEVQTNWHLATSGTTGTPKWITHSLKSLTTSTKVSKNLQALRWALLYQPFRFAGLQVVLQALLSGADLVDAAEQPAVTQVDILRQARVTAISATPSLWRQLIMTGKMNHLSLSHITLGGEIADQKILDSLKTLFPLATMRHIYASTEVGVGLVVTDGLAGFPAEWLENDEKALALKVSNEQHLLIKPLFSICKSLVTDKDTQGYVDTHDVVQIIDARVMFLGRATGTINVGGNKVHPEKVEQVLLQCPAINEAKVFAKKSPLIGELVVAQITLNADVQLQEVKLQALQLCKKQLQRFEIPTKISVVDKLSHDPSGKLNRNQQHD